MNWLGRVLKPNGSITKSARRAMGMASAQGTSMEMAARISSLPRAGLKRLSIGEMKNGAFTRNSNLAQQDSFLLWTSMATNFRISLTSLGHDYGIFWLEQQKTANGERSWSKHVIDNSWSQAHAMTLVDLNGDGQLEIVTGKRYMAHNGNDPGEREPLGVYWYEWLTVNGRLEWKKHIIDYSTRAGGGMQIPVIDIDRDGDLDVVTAGKSGLFLFEQSDSADE